MPSTSSIRLPRFYYAGLLSVLGGLALWELVSRVVVANSLFLAAPSQIFGAIVTLAGTGELWRHMWISAVELKDSWRLGIAERRPAQHGRSVRHG